MFCSWKWRVQILLGPPFQGGSVSEWHLALAYCNTCNSIFGVIWWPPFNSTTKYIDSMFDPQQRFHSPEGAKWFHGVIAISHAVQPSCHQKPQIKLTKMNQAIYSSENWRAERLFIANLGSTVDNKIIRLLVMLYIGLIFRPICQFTYVRNRDKISYNFIGKTAIL